MWATGTLPVAIQMRMARRTTAASRHRRRSWENAMRAFIVGPVSVFTDGARTQRLTPEQKSDGDASYNVVVRGPARLT